MNFEGKRAIENVIALGIIILEESLMKLTSPSVVIDNYLEVKMKKRRKSYSRGNYEQSCWGLMMQNKQNYTDPTSRNGMLFRKRFRMTFESFVNLVHTVTSENLFPYKSHDVTGRKALSLELKILGALRVLGRSSTFDCIAELTNSSAEVHRTFFHQFCSVINRHFFNIYIKPPQNQEEIQRITSVYEKLGLPGCIGSVDCVHIHWDKCPAKHKNLYKGKEGYPSVSYEVVCDHTHRILSTTAGHYGSRNDKTIVRYDSFVTSIHRKEKFHDVNFDLFNEQSNLIQERGCYLISDNGYHRREHNGYQFVLIAVSIMKILLALLLLNLCFK